MLTHNIGTVRVDFAQPFSLQVCLRGVGEIPTLLYKYRLYPLPAEYKTHYIPRERSVLEYSRGSAEGKARGTSEAEQKHWPFPRDVTGITSRWPGIQLTYTMLRLF